MYNKRILKKKKIAYNKYYSTLFIKRKEMKN